ncbi:MAG: MnhB domain-containing protein [Pirellulaceae bacterium]
MSDQKPAEGMSLIVKTTCSWLKGFILLYGIHIILYGHLTPGGGFAGGVIAASAFLLILLAEGERAGLKTFSKKAALTWRSLGALIFLAVAGLGLVVTGTFFGNFWTGHGSYNFTHFGSNIQVSEIGIGLLVCSSLYLVAMVLFGRASGFESEC